MHEFLKSPDDVLALKLTGTITGEDLDAIMDRTDAIMTRHDKIHVYVETHDVDGMQLSALPHHMGRAFPLFGKLGRHFEEVAGGCRRSGPVRRRSRGDPYAGRPQRPALAVLAG